MDHHTKSDWSRVKKASRHSFAPALFFSFSFLFDMTTKKEVNLNRACHVAKTEYMPYNNTVAGESVQNTATPSHFNDKPRGEILYYHNGVYHLHTSAMHGVTTTYLPDKVMNTAILCWIPLSVRTARVILGLWYILSCKKHNDDNCSDWLDLP